MYTIYNIYKRNVECWFGILCQILWQRMPLRTKCLQLWQLHLALWKIKASVLSTATCSCDMSQYLAKELMRLCKSKRVARGRAEAPAVFRKPTKPVKRTHGVPLAKCMAYLLRNTWPTKLEIFDKADFCRVQQIRTQFRNIRQGCVKITCISIANPAIVRAGDA